MAKVAFPQQSSPKSDRLPKGVNGGFNHSACRLESPPTRRLVAG